MPGAAGAGPVLEGEESRVQLVSSELTGPGIPMLERGPESVSGAPV